MNIVAIHTSLFVALLICFFGISANCQQSAPDATAIQARQRAGADVARKISWKMRDSLGLDSSTTAQLYQLTLPFHSQKMAIVRQYHGKPAMSGLLQQLEQTRDSLYATLLTSQQYQLYRAQKRWFVFNN